jgi:hypothetical protein
MRHVPPISIFDPALNRLVPLDSMPPRTRAEALAEAERRLRERADAMTARAPHAEAFAEMWLVRRLTELQRAVSNEEPPWNRENFPEDVPAKAAPEREPLAQMREVYEQLRPEICGLKINAQHRRVLAALGINGKHLPAGYGYETFRTKLYRKE